MRKQATLLMAGRCAFCLLLGWASASRAQNHPELAWQVVETEHFRIFYHEGLEGAAARAARIAEAAYAPLTELYGYAPDGRVRIVLKDHDDYANGAAFFYQDTIEIWATSLDHDFDLRGSSDWLRNVITHEFAHIISLGVARKGVQRVPALYLQYFGYQREKNRPDILIGYPDVIASYPVMGTVMPMWLAEGAAQYGTATTAHDRWDANRDMVLRSLVLADEQLSFEQMGVFGKQGFGNEYVYDHGFGLVRYIAETYGEEKIAELYRAASGWHTLAIDGACKKVLGKSENELYDEWIESLRQSYRAQVAALGPLREGEQVVDVGFSNLRPRLAPNGEKLAYLSTRKRHHGPHGLIVRDLATGEEEVAAFPAAASTVDWSPDGSKLLFSRIDRADKYGSRQADIYEWDSVATGPSFWRNMLWFVPAMVSGTAPETPRVKRLTRGMRALYPTYSPDGEWIVFVQNKGTSNNLAMMRADGTGLRYLTHFADGTQLYTPRFSPDGRKLAFAISHEGQRDLAVVELDADAAGATPLLAEGTFDLAIATPGTDRDPAWSADGTQLVFASDFSGIFNIYALNLETSALRQITNTVGGAFSPSVGSDGEVVFTAYTAAGFEIRRLQDEGTPVAAEEAWFSQDVPPDWRGTPVPALPSAPQAYGIDFLKTGILPRLFMDEGHFKAGAYLTSGDVLNRQSVLAGGAIAPDNADRDLFAIYEFKGFRPTFFLEVFNQRRRSARGDSSEARAGIVNAVNFSLSQLSVGMRGKLGRHGELTASATYDRYDASVQWDAFVPRRDGGLGFERQRQKPFGYTYLNGFGLGLTYRMELISRRRDRDINPLGRQLYARYDRMFNYFIDGFNEQSSFIDENYIKLFYNQFTVDWKEYVSMPGNTRLGLRLYGGWIDSDAVTDTSQVGGFFDYRLGGLNFMKGYTFYSIEGRKALMGTAMLRFPLLPDMGKRIAQLYFDKVYGAVYGSMGKAWDRSIGEWNERYGRDGPLRDVGGQLRFDLISYYSVPTRVQLDVAYGIDEVQDKGRWKSYFTVLFGYL